MPRIHGRSRSARHLLPLCLLTAWGCDTPPAEPETADESLRGVEALPAGGASGLARGINGKLLYEKALGKQHAVQFFEFSHGAVAVRESLSMEDQKKAFLDANASLTSLTEVFRRLNPGTAVPAAIVEADRRFVEAQRSPFGPPSSASEPKGSWGRSPAESISAGGQGSCSADNLGDGWGGDWFIANQCTAGSFRYCEKNIGWAQWTWKKRPWASWRQMEGDFNVPGRIYGTVIDCHWWGCEPRKVMFDYAVQPRRIEIWNYGNTDDEYSVRGESPCGHLHVAFLRN